MHIIFSAKHITPYSTPLSMAWLEVCNVIMYFISFAIMFDSIPQHHHQLMHDCVLITCYVSCNIQEWLIYTGHQGLQYNCHPLGCDLCSSDHLKIVLKSLMNIQLHLLKSKHIINKIHVMTRTHDHDDMIMMTLFNPR